MKCPQKNCGSFNISVINSYSEFASFILRYRRCKDCGSTFQTKELIIEGTLKEPSEELLLLQAEDKSSNNHKNNGRKTITGKK